MKCIGMKIEEPIRTESDWIKVDWLLFFDDGIYSKTRYANRFDWILSVLIVG